MVIKRALKGADVEVDEHVPKLRLAAFPIQAQRAEHTKTGWTSNSLAERAAVALGAVGEQQRR